MKSVSFHRSVVLCMLSPVSGEPVEAFLFYQIITILSTNPWCCCCSSSPVLSVCDCSDLLLLLNYCITDRVRRSAGTTSAPATDLPLCPLKTTNCNNKSTTTENLYLMVDNCTLDMQRGPDTSSKLADAINAYPNSTM